VEKILISACLFGENVRYDAGHCLIDDPIFSIWQAEGRLVPICPEMAGGLPAPRAPCEGLNGRVLDKEGYDYTDAFEKGANLALQLVHEYDIRFALLKEQSPSCGVNINYDGSFTSQKIPGDGVTARLLKAQGLSVYSEFQLAELKADIGVI